MVFCANCGAEIKNPQSQNFCEKCGSTISASVKEEGEKSSTVMTPSSTIASPTSMGFEPYDRPGGLFDINRNYYILKEKYWDI